MSFDTWLLFVLVEAALCLTPGPAVLFVTSTALGAGARPALLGAGGVVAANTLYFVLSALGVAALILASATLFTGLKWLGAVYLIWLGARMLHGAWRARACTVAGHGAGGDSVGRGGAAARSTVGGASRYSQARGVLRGFAVQAANPKALAFFVSLLPQFVDPLRPIASQIAILCATSAVIELGALSLYTALAVRARTLVGARAEQALRGAAGALLIAAGARLALLRGAP